MVLHVSGKFFNISSMLIYCLINITVHIWKEWQCKVCICCSLNCYRNLCAVNYTTLMFSHQNNQLLLVHDKHCLVSNWPAAFLFEILMTTFVELHVVARRSWTWAGHPEACLDGQFQFIRTMLRPCRAVPWPWDVAFRMAWSEHVRGAAWAWHSMCESNTAALCKSSGKDTI